MTSIMGLQFSAFPDAQTGYAALPDNKAHLRIEDRMKTAATAFVIALLFSAPAFAELGFEEFEHSTVDFSIPHTILAGAVLCHDSELPEMQTFEQRGCTHLGKAIKVKVELVYHGITQPQFYVRAVKGPVKGWTIRSNIQ